MTDLSNLTGTIRDEQTVGTLQALLRDAEAGKIVAIGVVAVTGIGQIGAFAAGRKPTEVYVGADILKANLLASMHKPAKSPVEV